jgi:hypothetical protein
MFAADEKMVDRPTRIRHSGPMTPRRTHSGCRHARQVAGCAHCLHEWRRTVWAHHPAHNFAVTVEHPSLDRITVVLDVHAPAAATRAQFEAVHLEAIWAQLEAVHGVRSGRVVAVRHLPDTDTTTTTTPVDAVAHDADGDDPATTNSNHLFD